jgi:hypothetical protein
MATTDVSRREHRLGRHEQRLTDRLVRHPPGRVIGGARSANLGDLLRGPTGRQPPDDVVAQPGVAGQLYPPEPFLLPAFTAAFRNLQAIRTKYLSNHRCPVALTKLA